MEVDAKVNVPVGRLRRSVNGPVAVRLILGWFDRLEEGMEGMDWNGEWGLERNNGME